MSTQSEEKGNGIPTNLSKCDQRSGFILNNLGHWNDHVIYHPNRMLLCETNDKRQGTPDKRQSRHIMKVVIIQPLWTGHHNF